MMPQLLKKLIGLRPSTGRNFTATSGAAGVGDRDTNRSVSLRRALRHHVLRLCTRSGEEVNGATDAKATELETRSLQLQAAINKIGQGLSMFDASSRLLLCNTQYLIMYGLTPELVEGGCTLRQLLELKVKAGTFFGDVDQAVNRTLDSVATGKSTRRLDRWIDGRVIAIVTSPIEGGAWVTTHEDITEHAHTMQELHRTKNFFYTIIDHVPATILVKDARTFRYLLVNKKGEEFIGSPKQQIIGRTAHEIFSPDAAKTITDDDRATLCSDRQVGYESPPFHRPGDDSQMVFTQKLIVHGPDGEADYLLSIIEDVTERVRAARQLSYQAHHDTLTGLANRVLFTERIGAALSRLARDGDRFAVMVLDLDRFKSVNDSLGHPIGDSLLKAAAQRLETCLRDEDLVARLGGDEFALLQVCNGDQREAAISLSNHVLDLLATTFDVEGHQVVTSTSIGIAFAPEHGTDVDQLLKCADLALYQAKSAGRNRYCIFDAAMEMEAHSRHALEIDLRNGIVRAEFEMHYQSIINIATGRPCGVEALVRWKHPQRGMVAPGDFIPLAEETGLIVPLGDWILRQACTDGRAWPADIKVAVNLSPVQFGKGDLMGAVSRALSDSGFPPHRLELEITESVLLHNNEENIAILAALKSLGVSIVLDDFGTGYSSLSYLRMFPFDKIKIDRSFVREISTRSDCAAIVCAVTSLAQTLNIATTAEGVETQDQYLLLRTAGCSLAQGYLFSRPVPAAELPFAGSYRYEAGQAA